MPVAFGGIGLPLRPVHHRPRQQGQHLAPSGPEKLVAPGIMSASGVKLPSTIKDPPSNGQLQTTSIKGRSTKVTARSNHGPVDVNSKKKVRSLFARGTRGRGDPRNEAMRQARQRYMDSKSAKETGPVSGHGRNTSQADGSSEKQYPSLSQGRRTEDHGRSIPIHGPPSNLRPNNRFMRPEPRASIASSQQPNNTRGPLAQRQDDWTHWLELSVKLSRLDPSITTRDLWMTFNKEGSVIGIELFEDHNGRRDGKARVRFR